MANRSIQAKLLKIKKAKQLKRAYLKRWNVSSLADGRARVRPDMMKDYHGIVDGRDDLRLRNFGLNNPKQETRLAVLATLDKLVHGIPAANWITLRPGERYRTFLCWHIVHEEGTNKSRGTESYIIHHDILLGIVKRSVVFASSASAMVAYQRGFVAYEFVERYPVNST